MIVGSLLLILVAVVLLGVGLAQGSNPLLIGSIAASLLAAVALVVGARRVAAGRVDEPGEFDGELGHAPDDFVEAGVEAIALDHDGPGDPGGDDEDPPDEPAAQVVAPADAARVARMSVDVLVVDSRPRYHLATCTHLLGRRSEPVPVSEAVELGFTPCGRCEPDSALLAEAHRV